MSTLPLTYLERPAQLDAGRPAWLLVLQSRWRNGVRMQHIRASPAWRQRCTLPASVLLPQCMSGKQHAIHSLPFRLQAASLGLGREAGRPLSSAPMLPFRLPQLR